jgi:hypothetical protein
MNKVTFFGSEKDVTKAIAILKRCKNLENMKEVSLRLLIQRLIDEHDLKATIFVNNTVVWSKAKIITSLEEIMKNGNGTLYKLSQYFYQFLTQECGSTAPSPEAFVSKYGTVEHLKGFFKQNEFGKKVSDWVVKERTDVRKIVEAIEQRLFPFQSYLQAKEK